MPDELNSDQQAELIASVRDLLKLLSHRPDGRWCFNSLSRDGSKFDTVMDRIAAAMPQDEKPRSMTLRELIEDVDTSERITADDLGIIINTKG